MRAVDPRSTYKFESWYVARDDINILNSMATLSVNPQFSGAQWSLTGATNYRLGPAIDRWVDPAAPPANSMNTELASSEGHAKVAVKVTNLGAGTWRYDYAVMNLDFARAVIHGRRQTWPNLRVSSATRASTASAFRFRRVRRSAPRFPATASSTPNNWGASSVANSHVTWSTERDHPGCSAGRHRSQPRCRRSTGARYIRSRSW